MAPRVGYRALRDEMRRSADPAAAEDAVGFVEHDGLAGGDAELGFGEVHVQAIAVDGDFRIR